MSVLGRFGGRAAAAGIASAVASTPSTVQARAPVHATRAPRAELPAKTLDDDWLVTDYNHKGDVILFKPFQAEEVDAALSEVANMVALSTTRGPLVQLEEEDAAVSGISTPSSEGSQANAVISGTCWTGCGAMLQARSDMDYYQSLLAVTNKMLKRPGMQKELITAMMEDPEIQDILLREAGDLDNYLLAAGVAPVRHLLPGSAAAAASGTIIAEEGEGQGKDKDIMSHLVDAIASTLEQAGSAISTLGTWLRSRMPLLGAPPQVQHKGEVQGEQAKGKGKGSSSTGGKGDAQANMLRGVLALGVMVLALLIFRRPGMSFMLRRRV